MNKKSIPLSISVFHKCCMKFQHLRQFQFLERDKNLGFARQIVLVYVLRVMNYWERLLVGTQIFTAFCNIFVIYQKIFFHIKDGEDWKSQILRETLTKIIINFEYSGRLSFLLASTSTTNRFFIRCDRLLQASFLYSAICLNNRSYGKKQRIKFGFGEIMC